METKSPTIGELDEAGVRLYSRWQSMKTGAELIVVSRSWQPGGFIIVNVLDVRRERTAEVRADDWLRWIRSGSVKRN
jgi:hypothetical protein